MITADLAALLGTVRRPGDFFAAGTAELLAPLLEVEGVGPVALAAAADASQATHRRGRTRALRPRRGDRGRPGGSALLADRPGSGAHPRPALGADTGDDPGPRRRGAGRGRADHGRVLQAAALRRGRLLRRPPRHREGARHVRDPRGRAAVVLRGRRAGRAPQGPRGPARPALRRPGGGGLRRLLRRLRARGPARHRGLPPDPGLQPGASRQGPIARAARLRGRAGPRRRAAAGLVRREEAPRRRHAREAGLSAGARLHAGRARVRGAEGRRCRHGRRADRGRAAGALRPASGAAHGRGERRRRVFRELRVAPAAWGEGGGRVRGRRGLRPVA